ncbi:MAG: T9SS type A sorting domain-containing protein [Cytophagales bacterium]
MSNTGAISSSCGTVTDIGASDNLSESTSIFPNPSEGPFTIRTKEIIKNISISNENGNEVFFKDNIEGGIDFEIDINLAEGIYFIKIQNLNGTIETHKFVRSKN